MTTSPLYPLSEFTPEEAAKVAEFDAAPTAPEDAEAALIEVAAAALAEAANAGSVFDPIDLDPEMYEANEEDREYFRGQARAALAVFRGQQDPAVRRVLALAELWEREEAEPREERAKSYPLSRPWAIDHAKLITRAATYRTCAANLRRIAIGGDGR